MDLTRHGVVEAKGLIDRISVTFLWQSPVRVGREKDNCEGAKGGMSVNDVCYSPSPMGQRRDFG